MQNTQVQPAPAKFCFACGTSVDPRAEICPKCGVRQTAPIAQKSRITTALLAFFLGGLGVHRFYLGNIGLGFLYLIFCWTFIPAVVAFVEFIIFLVMSDEEFARKYNT
tara:strand:+ start:1018 stop:1341 length:324 start_codon:yes stop_codon:yes gene_type:complete